MAVSISIKVDDKEVQKMFTNIKSGVSSFKEPLTGASEELSQKFFGDKVFQTSGAAVGNRWAPLAASTLQARARRTGHYKNAPITTSKIMIWTGALKSGFKNTVTAFKAVITNKVKYFKFTEQKRAVFGINAEVINIITKHFEKYLKKIIKK